MDLFASDPPSSELFREVRGSSRPTPVELPWQDVELAVLIAVNRLPGADLALALDYRTDPADPRVVGSDFWTDPRQCAWREVAPTFSSFADALGLQLRNVTWIAGRGRGSRRLDQRVTSRRRRSVRPAGSSRPQARGPVSS